MPLTQAQQAHADTLTDEDLVDLARARDEAAVRSITKRYNRRLFRIARSILRDDEQYVTEPSNNKKKKPPGTALYILLYLLQNDYFGYRSKTSNYLGHTV